MPDKAIDLIDEACAQLRTEMDSMPAELDEISRKIMQLEIEEAALKKENDRLSQDRLVHLQQELAELREDFAGKKAQWDNEKVGVEKVQKLREEIEKLNAELDKAKREYDLNRAAEIEYGKLPHLKKELEQAMEVLQMDPSYGDRDLNVGFSGGEKKKAEILQMLMLEPKLAILDETDSGLDVDAVRTVSEGVRLFRERTHGSLLIITHSTRILEALHVDAAHVMEDGVIVRNGGAELVDEINEKGFSSLKED